MKDFKPYYKPGNVFQRYQQYYKQTPRNSFRRSVSPNNTNNTQVIRLGNRNSMISSSGRASSMTSTPKSISNNLLLLVHQNQSLRQKLDDFYRLQGVKQEGTYSPEANKLKKYTELNYEQQTILKQEKTMQQLRKQYEHNANKIRNMENIRLAIREKLTAAVHIDQQINSRIRVTRQEVQRILKTAKSAIFNKEDPQIVGAILQQLLQLY